MYSSTYSWFSIFQVKNLAFNPAPLQSASELFNTIKIIQIGNIKIGSIKIRYNLYFHMQQQLPSLQYCHSKPNTAFSVAALWPYPNFNMQNLGNLLNGNDNSCRSFQLKNIKGVTKNLPIIKKNYRHAKKMSNEIVHFSSKITILSPYFSLKILTF